ncbi:MAG: TatD family hydrolase, partial [Thermodesulfobacteriota bacterium]|nr:TatD family hydrolase [Thermodesulfobacteriota bacterium]
LLDEFASLPVPALVPAIAESDWLLLLDRYGAVDDLWLALGVHPQYAAGWYGQSLVKLRRLIHHPKVVAIGEVGLDAGLTNVSMTRQQQVLQDQVRLAVAVGKPLILHCYKRFGALLQLLRNERADSVGGIVHGFSGSSEVALQLWQMGFGIGIGRVILNERTRRLPKTVITLPDEALVLETDAPWPTAVTGGEDGAGALLHIAERIAVLRGQTLAEVADMTERNARRLLNLSCNNGKVSS